VKRRAKRLTHRQFLQEGRAILLEDSDAVFHGLGCESCGLRGQALTALSLVDWTEAEFVTAWMERQAGV